MMNWAMREREIYPLISLMPQHLHKSSAGGAAVSREGEQGLEGPWGGRKFRMASGRQKS